MQKGIIVSKDAKVREECQTQLEPFQLELVYTDDLETLSEIENDFNFLFLLIHNFHKLSLEKLSALQDMFPAVAIILYNDSLISDALTQIGHFNGVHLLIGPGRAAFLQKTVRQIMDTYWRKIPLDTIGVRIETLSPRIQKAIRFIEEHRLNECTLTNLSAYLGISAGYFTQEFKRETGYSFRKFIQLALHYYEDRVFPKLNISAQNMAKILGYSELSSFSRSFKRRQGVSPGKFKKKNKISLQKN